MILLVLGDWSRASLLKVNKGLKVKRGQVAFLREDDLQFHIPRQKDACKVEVVLEEPISQRVGQLLPQVRDPAQDPPGALGQIRFCVRWPQPILDLVLSPCRCSTVTTALMRSDMSTTAVRCCWRTPSASGCTGAVQRSHRLISVATI